MNAERIRQSKILWVVESCGLGESFESFIFFKLYCRITLHYSTFSFT